MSTSAFKDIIPGFKNEDVNGSSSSEKFQKFIYEEFEKNGVLSDLRAYLRSNIVNVLKAAQTGKPTMCQRKFTQRLELTNQALSMLIAEYLLRLDFSYSLSVFVSEIPLSNMEFEFAKSLLNVTDETDTSKLRLSNNDIWSILNYLGVKCDSINALSIVRMYKKESNLCLLNCILKCMMPCQKDSENEQLSSAESLISSVTMSSDTVERSRRKMVRQNCHHFAHCKTCQNKMKRVREKYKSRKRNLEQGAKHVSEKTSGERLVLKNSNVMDQCVVNEMFYQLKSVYETEVAMMRQEDEGIMKRSLATHALQLEKRREEMEESYKKREMELECNIQKKKKFVWALARSLRDQHADIARAVHCIRKKTEKLSDKEGNIKKHMMEAEELLNQRGLEMRKQISEELAALTSQIETMKLERDNINKEREALENIKTTDQNTAFHDSLKNELQVLKKLYAEMSKLEPKTFIEVGTLTDCFGVKSRTNLMNNEQDVDMSDDKMETHDRVVNILKKKKNVNYKQVNMEDVCSGSKSMLSNDADSQRDTITKLREENTRLASFAAQQRSYIDELTSQRARLQAELTSARFSTSRALVPVWRPRTAPAVMSNVAVAHTLSLAASGLTSVGYNGGGETVDLFAATRPRVVLPTDHIPFIGSMQEHDTNRRHLLNQWRSLRPHTSPLGGVIKNRVAQRDRQRHDGISQPFNPTDTAPDQDSRRNGAVVMLAYKKLKSPITRDASRSRDISPKTVLREAKQNLKSKTNICKSPSRENNPSSILRDARLRLRKLEIEAEAVEKSYMDFRKRQSKLRGENLAESVINADFAMEFHTGYTPTELKFYENISAQSIASCSKSQELHDSNTDLHKYLREYDKIDISDHFRNKTTSINSIKPIPKAYSEVNINEDCQSYYLDTPLIEFRKLYQSKETPNSVIECVTENAKDNQNTIQNSETKNHEVQGKRSSPELNKESEIKTSQTYYTKIIEVLPPKTKSPSPERNVRESKSNDVLNNEISDLTNVEIHSSRKISPDRNTDKDLERVKKSHNINMDDFENQKLEEKNDNYLCVEIENTVRNSLKLTDSIDNVMLVVESPPNTGELNVIDTQDSILKMLVTPNKKGASSPSMSLNKSIKGDIIYEIYRDTSNETKCREEVEESLNEEEDLMEYPDDFSADVDNYDSRSVEDLNSPISLPKSLEDENYW